MIEKVDSYEFGETHYLPHRPVLRDEKETTKMRVVFDASCASPKDGYSLNDVLYQGPTMTQELIDILLRFRSYNYVMTADIEKAFLQISIASEHRNFVRFLWFKNINNIDYENFDNTKLVEYRFCRILFGLTSSPFLLEATIDKHISEHENTDILLKDKLKNSLHVDDLNAGADSIEDAKTFYDSAKACLRDGGFNLRKFKSNSKELENMVYRENPKDQMFTSEKKVLGINWQKENDTIFFDFQELKFCSVPTKRSVLKSMAS